MDAAIQNPDELRFLADQSNFLCPPSQG